MAIKPDYPEYCGDSCERGRCSRAYEEQPKLTKYGYLYFCNEPSCFEKWQLQISQQTPLEDYLYRKFVASRKYYIPFCRYCLTRTMSIWARFGGYCSHCFNKHCLRIDPIEEQLELIPLIVDISTFHFALEDYCVYEEYYVNLNNVITILQKRTHDNLTSLVKRAFVEVLKDKILELEYDADGNTIDFNLLPTLFHIFAWRKPITLQVTVNDV